MISKDEENYTVEYWKNEKKPKYQKDLMKIQKIVTSAVSSSLFVHQSSCRSLHDKPSEFCTEPQQVVLIWRSDYNLDILNLKLFIYLFTTIE